MKQAFLSLAALLLACTLFAQPVLQSTVVPNVGVNVYVAEADTNTALPGNPGANQTWNFSAMQPVSPPSYNQYIAPAGTPYANEFPTANLVIKVGQGDTAIYSYARKETNQLLTLGIRSNTYTVNYLNTDAQIKYPTNFNGTYDDTYSYTTDAGTGVVFLSQGSRTVKYDAYGTLTTPLGTFPNAMRIRAVSSQKDSANFLGNEFINYIDYVTYDWLVAGQPGAVVSMSFIHVISETRIPGFDTLTSETGPTKTLNYISTATTGVFSPAQAPQGLTLTALAPNPAADQLSVRFSVETGGRVLNLLITDAAGRIVQTQTLLPSAGENDYLLPVGQLASGTYQLTLFDGKRLLTRNWVKE